MSSHSRTRRSGSESGEAGTANAAVRVSSHTDQVSGSAVRVSSRYRAAEGEAAAGHISLSLTAHFNHILTSSALPDLFPPGAKLYRKKKQINESL